MVQGDTEHLQTHLLSSWVETRLNSHGTQMKQGVGRLRVCVLYPTLVWTRSGSGLTFMVDLVVQGDRATAPLDGPTGLFLCACIQWNALSFASDATFQLQGKNKQFIFFGAANERG